MKHFSLLIKPASADCNLRCNYCFYIDHLEGLEKKPRMSDKILEVMIASYMKTNQNQYAFGWQGGEPTLMGIEFFKNVIELQKKYAPLGAVITNGLQTNATLMTDDLASFYARNKFLLGVSLDGPPSFHNEYRKYVGGKPTHSAVMKGIEILRKNKVEFNILTLVNNLNVQEPEKIYDYLLHKGFFYHQYIPCVEWDQDGRLESYSVSGKGWGNFLCKIFDRWYDNDTDLVSIRLFDSILAYIIDNQYAVCYMDNNCCQYFVVEYNGDVYPCDFHVNKELKLGNVMEGSWENFLQMQSYKDFGRKKGKWNQKCDYCDYLDYCHGDCLKHRNLGFNKPDSLSYLCEGWKIFYKHTLPKFEKLAVRFKKRREIVNSPSNIKIGRNDVCPCGSGRKYKNCCLKFRRDFKQ